MRFRKLLRQVETWRGVVRVIQRSVPLPSKVSQLHSLFHMFSGFISHIFCVGFLVILDVPNARDASFALDFVIVI